jgi:hypothetical protein
MAWTIVQIVEFAKPQRAHHCRIEKRRPAFFFGNPQPPLVLRTIKTGLFDFDARGRFPKLPSCLKLQSS